MKAPKFKISTEYLPNLKYNTFVQQISSTNCLNPMHRSLYLVFNPKFKLMVLTENANIAISPESLLKMTILP